MLLRAVLAALLLLVLLPTASFADCRTITVPTGVPGEFVVIEVCDGDTDPEPNVPPPVDDGDPDNGGGGQGQPPATPVGGGPPAVSCSPTIPVYDMGGVLGQVPEPREDGSIWSEWYFDCSDGTTEIRQRCMGNCPVADPADPNPPAAPVVRFRSIPDLRLEALGKVDPPVPGVRHSFDQPAESGDVRAIVLAEQWWWAEVPLEPITSRATDGPVWVEVTATPGDMEIDPGDGSGALSCATPGLAYNRNVSYYDQTPGGPRGACVHIYESTSEAMTASMSIAWTLTWEGSTPTGGPVSGTLEPIVRSESVTFPVQEIQSVIVG